jgi:hypothetical protein
MHEIEQFEHYGRTVRIFYDEDGGSCNPRDWDNVSTIIGVHARRTIGDKHDYRAEDFDGWDAMEGQIERDNPGAIILPLFMLDHSGIALNTTGFACPWDSGRVGFVIATRASIAKVWGWKVITKARRAKLIEAMRAEVNEYSQWCNGEVYGYTVSEPEDPETKADSCWGFIGFDYVREAAKEAATPVGVTA